MFFFFFNDLSIIPEIRQAFKYICIDKMLTDGYFDMSIYINGKLTKDAIHSQLKACNSRYAVLYEKAYPQEKDAFDVWTQLIVQHQDNRKYHSLELSHIEAVAIVNWVYRIIKKAPEREEFTRKLMKDEKALFHNANDIELIDCVVYNKVKVALYFISSFSDFDDVISQHVAIDKQLFYRGHTNANHKLIPSIMRSSSWKKNESRMYNDLMIECPEDFSKTSTHLERLVKM